MDTIGFDARMIAHSGIGTYIKGLLSTYRAVSNRAQEEICLYGDQRLKNDFPEYSIKTFQSGIYSIQEQALYPQMLKHCRLWHSPHYNVPVLRGKTKIIATIHDIIHWVFRDELLSPIQKMYAGSMLKRAVRSDHIITVSEHTKKDLIQYFDADPDRITVIYEGIGGEFKMQENSAVRRQLKEKYGVPDNYFLYVGLLKPHKNVKWLVDIFKEMKRAGKITSTLVVVGKKDKKYRSGYQSLADLKSGEGIIYIPYATTEELVQLYNGTFALIHPSRYEGFGLTLLEAMACGAPVVACRTASLPEITGDAAHLIDPCSHHELEDALIRMEGAGNMREDLRRRGWKNVQRFRWEEAAKKTYRIYEKVLSS